jgi:two-component system, sensor histidine kinase and response regulator
VLVAEDMAINRLLMQGLLARVGITPDLAADGREAVDMALRAQDGAPYDMIFMDIQMPEMDGLEAARLIRQDPRLARTPIIALTAHALDEQRDECIKAGMDGHFPKPIRPAALYDLIESWAGRLGNITSRGRG